MQDRSNKRSEFLETAMKRFKQCSNSSTKIRQMFVDDIKFLAGDQWDEFLKNERKNDKRPALTINRLPASHNQVVNDFRQNRPSIKVRPVDSLSDTDKADVINGLLRRIQNNGDSKTAIDTAFFYAVGGGFGFVRVKTDYTTEDSFDQEIFIEKIDNPCTVYFPIDSISRSDYSDAMYCFVRYTIDKEEFKKKYPEIKLNSFDETGIGDSTFLNDDYVYVLEYFWIEEEELYLALLNDGSTHFIKSKINTGDQVPDTDLTVEKVRDATKRSVHRALITQFDILEEDTIFPGNWLPIVPMLGQEMNIEGEKFYISLTRNAKDPQKMFNFWNSAFTEQIALAPKTPWLIAEGQVEGFENVWKDANNKNISYLPYKPVSSGGQLVSPPIRTQPPSVGSAIITGIQYASDNLKATTGIYDASLGAAGNETSGRAINARQRQGSTANFHFSDNAARCLKHLGVIIKDLIPVIYDSADRVVRIIGEDQQDKVITINRTIPEKNGQLYDTSVGNYDVVVDIGPSYETKRIEMTETLLSLSQSNPIYSQIAPDILVQNLDFAGRDELSKRLKSYLKMQFPQLDIEDKKDQKDKAAQQQQQLQQAQQVIDQLTQQTQQAQQQIQQDQQIINQMSQAIQQMEQKIVELQLRLQNKEVETSTKFEIEKMKLELAKLKLEQDFRTTMIQESNRVSNDDKDFMLKVKDSQRKDIELASKITKESEPEEQEEPVELEEMEEEKKESD